MFSELQHECFRSQETRWIFLGLAALMSAPEASFVNSSAEPWGNSITVFIFTVMKVPQSGCVIGGLRCGIKRIHADYCLLRPTQVSVVSVRFRPSCVAVKHFPLDFTPVHAAAPQHGDETRGETFWLCLIRSCSKHVTSLPLLPLQACPEYKHATADDRRSLRPSNSACCRANEIKTFL